MKQKEFTSMQIEFLKKMNDYLGQMEKAFLEKCRTLKNIYEPRLTKNGGDLEEWQIFFEVGYSGKENHSVRDRLCHLEYMLNKDEFFVFQSIDAKENIEARGIDAGWCDLMTRVYKHAQRWYSIFNVSSITISIKIREKLSLKELMANEE